MSEPIYETREVTSKDGRRYTLFLVRGLLPRADQVLLGDELYIERGIDDEETESFVAEAIEHLNDPQRREKLWQDHPLYHHPNLSLERRARSWVTDVLMGDLEGKIPEDSFEHYENNIVTLMKDAVWDAVTEVENLLLIRLSIWAKTGRYPNPLGALPKAAAPAADPAAAASDEEDSDEEDLEEYRRRQIWDKPGYSIPERVKAWRTWCEGWGPGGDDGADREFDDDLKAMLEAVASDALIERDRALQQAEHEQAIGERASADADRIARERDELRNQLDVLRHDAEVVAAGLRSEIEELRRRFKALMDSNDALFRIHKETAKERDRLKDRVVELVLTSSGSRP